MSTQVVGFVNIGISPDGNVLVQAQGPELLIRGAIQKALEQLSAEWARQKSGPKIAVPSPEMVNQLNGIAT